MHGYVHRCHGDCRCTQAVERNMMDEIIAKVEGEDAVKKASLPVVESSTGMLSRLRRNFATLA